MTLEARMTFGLIAWLKSHYADLNFDIPVWHPAKDQPDSREWLVTNGEGGFSCGTVSGAYTRRYHALLVASLAPPSDRHNILSRVDEIVTVDGVDFQLATNYWASGVVSPTGYRLIESFTTLPVPTWVFELNGHYLIKQIALKPGTNEVHMGYFFVPDSENAPQSAQISVRFLVGYRNFHSQVRGSSADHYVQFVSPNHSVIILNESQKRLCLSWNRGEYQVEKQWWWDFQWPEETARNLPDSEDLFVVGSLTSELNAEKSFSVAASLDQPVALANCSEAVQIILQNQKALLRHANLPRSIPTDMLILAADQFIVDTAPVSPPEKSVFEGYPWFSECGRSAMVSLPGLTLTTRRFDDAKAIINRYSRQMVNGILPNRVIENAGEYAHPHTEFGAADVTLWWGHAVYQFFEATKDKEFVLRQLPLLFEAAGHYIRGTTGSIRVDSRDGLLRCANSRNECSWMDAKVAESPITPRAGKPVEICALWYNFLQSLLHLAQATDYVNDTAPELQALADLCKNSMQKFWNNDMLCLYDVLEPEYGLHKDKDASFRPNQILAVSLPFRTLEARQEKMVFSAVEAELFTPLGLRTVSPEDQSYQGRYGCGFAHADQYHRDISYHQGTAWPWLIGPYLDALVNVYGNGHETKTRVSQILQPLLTHMQQDAGLGTISEIFDGDEPQQARGAFAEAWSVAEVLRWQQWLLKR